jgi:hypothetical protein
MAMVQENVEAISDKFNVDSIHRPTKETKLLAA